MATKNTPTEEVDLGQLFKVIGNGFRNFFNAIGNFFKSLFHYFILVLIFIKKNILLLGIATLIGGLLGYFLDINKDAYFKSEMIIKTNYGSAKKLLNQSVYVNNLINNKDSMVLANYFNIKSTEASQLLGFEVKPYEKQKNLLIDYDYFIERRDTNFVEKFSFGDYSKRVSDEDLRFQKVTFYALNKSVFNKLSTGLKNSIETDYYKQIQHNSIEKLKLKRIRLERDLYEIDSLRQNYRNVALLNATNKLGSNNVNLSTENSNSKFNTDLDLFESSKAVLIQLENLKLDEDRSGEIATIVSDFNLGSKFNPLKNKKWFRYGILGFVLMTLFILSKSFNNYLDTYKKN